MYIFLPCTIPLFSFNFCALPTNQTRQNTKGFGKYSGSGLTRIHSICMSGVIEYRKPALKTTCIVEPPVYSDHCSSLEWFLYTWFHCLLFHNDLFRTICNYYYDCADQDDMLRTLLMYSVVLVLDLFLLSRHLLSVTCLKVLSLKLLVDLVDCPHKQTVTSLHKSNHFVKRLL